MEVLVLMTRRKDSGGRFAHLIDRSNSAARPRSGLDVTLALATVIGTGGGAFSAWTRGAPAKGILSGNRLFNLETLLF
jgi:hypothetical protein